ncbi:hypothetical protein V5O39_04085 [Pseudomonas parakoreensis]
MKHKMIAKIAGAIEATNAVDGDMFTFTRLLRKQKVYINLTLNEDGQPKGISFEFDGKYISGRQLKRSRLTWHKLTTQEGIHYDPKPFVNFRMTLREEIAKNKKELESITLSLFQLQEREEARSTSGLQPGTMKSRK